MRTFSMTWQQRWVSRAVFYLTTIGVMWAMGRIMPTSADLRAGGQTGEIQIIVPGDAADPAD
ncbi:MAG: hypothetical protein HKN23_01520 [Verrucomicrobiales bacterium]|nr:hypothetical protein [Verrucomicrobiales bacterium]